MLKNECAAEEASLRAATERERQQLKEFEERAAKVLRELEDLRKDAEEAVFEMDRYRVTSGRNNLQEQVETQTMARC